MLLKRILLQFTTKRKMAIDIGGMRKPYLGEHQAFEVKDLVSKEPFAQFEHWFEQAKSMKSIEEANAMCVATASKSGMPSARYVLLKVSLCSFLVNQINFNCKCFIIRLNCLRRI